MVLLENAVCLFVCLFVRCCSLFIPLLCDLLVLVTIYEDQSRFNMLRLRVCIFNNILLSDSLLTGVWLQWVLW